MLEEALTDPAPAGSARTVEHTSGTPDGRYAMTAMFSIVDTGGREHRYCEADVVNPADAERFRLLIGQMPDDAHRARA